MIHLLWQLPIMLLAFWQLNLITTWPAAWQGLIVFAPYVVAGLGIFIAAWLNRIQPIMVLLTVVALNLLLSYVVGMDRQSLSAHVLFPLLCLLLPLNLFFWLLIPEKGVHNHGYLTLLFSGFVAQALGLYWVLDRLPLSLIAYLSMPIEHLPWVLKIPMVPAVVTLIVMMLMLFRNAMCLRPKVLDSTLFMLLILFVVGLNQFESYGAMAWVSTLAGVLVLLSIIFDAHHIAYTDELTGLKGRRALYESFMGLGKRYTIAMMDIDHFKKFNDTYGHDVGDQVLRSVADSLAMIGSGSVYRYGGEEFTVVFKGKTPEEAKTFVEEVRQAIATTVLKVEHKGVTKDVKVTVSFGLAARNEVNKKPQEVMKAADQALYQAKNAGRNCSFISGTPPSKTPAKKIKV